MLPARDCAGERSEVVIRTAAQRGGCSGRQSGPAEDSDPVAAAGGTDYRLGPGQVRQSVDVHDHGCHVPRGRLWRSHAERDGGEVINSPRRRSLIRAIRCLAWTGSSPDRRDGHSHRGQGDRRHHAASVRLHECRRDVGHEVHGRTLTHLTPDAKKVILLYDSDTAGMAAANRARRSARPSTWISSWRSCRRARTPAICLGRRERRIRCHDRAGHRCPPV